MVKFSAKLVDQQLVLRYGQEQLALSWPAVAVSIGGRRLVPKKASSALEKTSSGWRQSFVRGSLCFQVGIEVCAGWIKKQLEISSTAELPTPDYVEVDAQEVTDLELSRRGYMATFEQKKRPGAEEEGGGLMPGCGYPLIGGKFFCGLEHPAAFNQITRSGRKTVSYQLRHFPVWENGRLPGVAAVLGLAAAPEEVFAKYVASIRLPRRQKPLFSFCSFWSDPYLGNYEYDIRKDNYLSLLRVFTQLGLHPDVITLDAGWQDRQTVFQAKKAFGGEKALRELGRTFRAQGIDLSLWVSHNGPMGMAPEFLRRKGIAIGKGESSAYCGDNYAVMLDRKLEALLQKRFCELAGPDYQTVHFKIDWDNECATSPEFQAKYPTRNHVRQGSIDAMCRIAAALRAVNPAVITRNGWWPSPWWLQHANHIFLSDSGDSEFAMLPSRTQRDSAATHRDIMYYNSLQRDRSAVPLDCFDNHELPHARRNPFAEERGSWVNTLWLSVLRGSSYFPYKLQPEALEDWQAESLREIMAFARNYAEHIIVEHGRMVLGHPGKGEIYGFLQPGQKDSWCLLRNPLPLPQTLRFDPAAISGQTVKSVAQFYPDYRLLPNPGELTFLPGEVKVMIISSRKLTLPGAQPFQVRAEGKGFRCYRPASACPQVPPVYQIPKLECGAPSHQTVEGRLQLKFKLLVPYRMRNFELQIKVSHPDMDKLQFWLASSRYDGWNFCCYRIPLTEVPYNRPGHGEAKNPDGFPKRRERFFVASIPQGGEAFFNFECAGAAVKPEQLEIWASGYEGPERVGEPCSAAPLGFTRGLPYQHPLGFPLAVRVL